MTARALLVELALIAGVCIVWTVLVLLMLERDRKRTERRNAHDEVSYDVATGRTENPATCFALPQNEEAGASTPAQENQDAL